MDQIESAVGNIVKKVDMLETKVKVLEEFSNEFEDSLSFMSSKVEELERSKKSENFPPK
jgi:hypothetical protein